MIKKWYLVYFCFAFFSFVRAQYSPQEIVQQGVTNANNCMNYANGGWINRAIYVGGGALVFGGVQALYHTNKTSEISRVFKLAALWGGIILIASLGVHAVVDNISLTKNYSGLIAHAVNVLGFVAFMGVSRGMKAGVMLILSAAGVTEAKKQLEQSNNKKDDQ